MDIVYAMPGQQHRMFISIVHACPNACLFCVDFKSDSFYGFDLKNGRRPTAQEIVAAVEAYQFRHCISEVYYCGIGEPLLLYDTVVETVDEIRALFPSQTIIAINTSGTFYRWYPRVDFARKFDLIQVSLNAENEEKYNLICRPKVPGAYKVLTAFLHDLRDFLDHAGTACRVELTVVDPWEREHLPEEERTLSSIPRPDVDACRRIAAGFGWPLKVKTLIKDCEREEWRQFAQSIREPVDLHTIRASSRFPGSERNAPTRR